MSERHTRRVRSSAPSGRRQRALQRRGFHRRSSVCPPRSLFSSTSNMNHPNLINNTNTTATTLAMLELEEEETESSVLSDFDMLNDAIQEFLLDSDDSGEDIAENCGEANIIHAVAPFLNAACVRPAAGRMRHASKSAPPVRNANTTTAAQMPRLTLAESMLPRCVRRRRHRRRVLLPSDKGLPQAPICIVLDLDETLVAARRECVHTRPHVKEFLDTCHAEGCEVVVWSAGLPSHVNSVIRVIAAVSQRRDWYHHVISRHSRWFHGESEIVKDLSLLGRPLNHVLILENSPRSVQWQPMHAILLEDYISPTAHDESLRLLAGVIRRLVAAMRASGDIASADVPRLLSADTTLMELLLPLSHPLSKDGSTMISRGLLYSPQTVFSRRSYGGEHPLSYQGGT